ncbi:MAG: ADP-glyceromanno-heptose 6-epimerase [Candidatus Eremiobacteraeota bacterium]|nr:ADP-glyceromanno-heptose 6-epimerase [Candidatus Eremiobacteraeota bacterium]
MHDLTTGRILVTGGAGFIGSALVWALNLRGIDDIVVADILDRGQKWKNLSPLRFRDYMDAAELEVCALNSPKKLEDIATVFHLGACSSTTEADAAYLMRNNFEYTKNLAGWAVSRGVRFLYASSAATYGALENVLCENRELRTLRPLNMYAYSKHFFDCYAQSEGWLEAITGLKYFNVFGPNEYHKGEMRSLVNKAFDQIADGGAVKLFKSHRVEYADGEQQRDFLYVKDAVEMTLHLAAIPQATGLFNVGSGYAHTWLDLIRPIFQAMQRPVDIEFIDMPPALRAQYQYSTCASLQRLRNTGYTQGATQLAAAVTDYVSNYLMVGGHLDPMDEVGSPRAMVNW